MISEWRCDVCKEVRPDGCISVRKSDISLEHGLPKGSFQQNVNYCNDNPDCVEKSKTHKMFKK